MLDSDIRSSKSLNVFKRKVLKFIRPKVNSFFNCLNPKRVKWITILRLGLSHLGDHKFKHSFQERLNPICSCGIEVETTAHYLLQCLKEEEPFWDSSKYVLLFGDNSVDDSSNTII